VRYIVGEPIYPVCEPQGGEGQKTENELARRVADSMRRLFEQYGQAALNT
jgi:hypothetical protein